MYMIVAWYGIVWIRYGLNMDLGFDDLSVMAFEWECE